MIYLDNNATTRPSARVVEAMLPFLNECYFNPSSSTAAFTGADSARREAASAMAQLLNAEEAGSFRFTSGATESNNWVCSSVGKRFTSGTVLISAIEHASVSEPAAELARRGFRVVEVPVDRHGVLKLDALDDALDSDTVLVSVMAANNETGVLQPLQEIGRIVRKRSPDALLHTDATQAVGKVEIDMQGAWEDVDLASFSAHKFHGPKGVGGLYIRTGVELWPLILGGGQEKGLRSGTTNTPGLAGLAVAAAQWNRTTVSSVAHIRNKFEAELRSHFPEVMIHSEGAERLPNTSCFSLPGVVGEDVAATLAAQGIIVGTGSACASGALRPSKTLLSMGVGYDNAGAVLRVSVSVSTQMVHVMTLIEHLSAALAPSGALRSSGRT